MEQVSVNKRLNLIVDTFEKGKKAAFARKVGISPQGAQELLAGRKGDPSFKVLVKILESYPQVRMEWLILGNGQMLLREGVVVDEVNMTQLTLLHRIPDAEVLETMQRHMKKKFEELDKKMILIFNALDISAAELPHDKGAYVSNASILYYPFVAAEGDDKRG